MTPTVIRIEVPPKNCDTANGIFRLLESMSGIIAIIVKKIAPASVILLIVLCKKVVVGFPGRTPGMYPPFLFKSSDIWISLNWVDTQKYEKNKIMSEYVRM